MSSPHHTLNAHSNRPTAHSSRSSHILFKSSASMWINIVTWHFYKHITCRPSSNTRLAGVFKCSLLLTAHACIATARWADSYAMVCMNAYIYTHYVQQTRTIGRAALQTVRCMYVCSCMFCSCVQLQIYWITTKTRHSQMRSNWKYLITAMLSARNLDEWFWWTSTNRMNGLLRLGWRIVEICVNIQRNSTHTIIRIIEIPL